MCVIREPKSTGASKIDSRIIDNVLTSGRRTSDEEAGLWDIVMSGGLLSLGSTRRRDLD